MAYNALMDLTTAHKLNELTTDFYARSADSFSASRAAPWPGWQRCLSLIRELPHEGRPLQILDIGCGNLRFEDFLAAELSREHEVWAIDNCPQLLVDDTRVLFQELDVISALIDGKNLNKLMEAPACDVVCSFGFLHHIPSAKARRAFIAAALEATLPGGLLMIALWQFAGNDRMARKAAKATARALERYPKLELDEEDYLLGWQEDQDVFRYCHSFTDAEVGALVTFAKMHGGHLIDSFTADGKTGDMNRYLVFWKR